MQRVKRHWVWIILTLTILFVVTVRVRLREMPLERDEGEYAYAGQLILHGIPPYREAYNMKLPGAYAAYAVIMGIFGQSPSGIHLGLALVNAASIVLVFLLGRKLLDDVAGMAAAVVFALLSLSPSILGLAGHGTHFVTLFALGGILVLLPRPPPRSRPRNRSLPPESQKEIEEENENEDENENQNDGKTRLFLSGLLFGIGFLMKQHGIFFGIFGGIYLVWTAVMQSRVQSPESRVRRKSRNSPSPYPMASQARHDLVPPQETISSRNVVPEGEGGGKSRVQTSNFKLHTSNLALFTTGFLLPYLLTCLVLWCAGVFPQFIFWTISYARQYAANNPLVSGPGLLRAGLNAVVGANFLLWMLPWAGALVMWWDGRLAEEGREVRGQRSEVGGQRSEARSQKSEVRGRRSEVGGAPNTPKLQNSKTPIPAPRFFLVALLFCSFASVSVGLIFRAHYFITLLPVLALLSGVAVSRSVYLLKHDKTIELFLAIPILGLFIIGSLASVIGNGSVFFADSPSAASLDTYGTTLFSEAAKAAAYIKQNSAKEERIAVVGSEPEIYFDSGRRSATGYIYTYPVMEEHPYAAKMREDMIGEIERGRPEYVVYVNDDFSWQAGATSGRRMHDWFQAYWAANLDLVTTMNIEEKHEETVETYERKEGAPDKKDEEAGKKYLLILKRKANLTTDKH